MVILIFPGEEETIINGPDDKVLIFKDRDEAQDFKIKNDLNQVSPCQRAIVKNLTEAEICPYLTKIQPLPDFLASSHELGAGDFMVIDNLTGEILSKKHTITYCDTISGFFVERVGGKLIAKNNEYVLHVNHNLEIIK